MFDHRITEDQIELAIGEGKLAAVGEDESGAIVARFCGAWHVEVDDSWPLRCVEQAPDARIAAHVEHGHIGMDTADGREGPHPLGAEMPAEGFQYRVDVRHFQPKGEITRGGGGLAALIRVTRGCRWNYGGPLRPLACT